SVAVRALYGLSWFPAAVDELAPPPSVDDAFSDLTSTCAAAYLADAGAAPIAFVHSVTAPAALRLVLPHLPDELHAVAFAYAWQACAGLLTAYGAGTVAPPTEPDISRDDLIDRATSNGDEHAIKFTEACLREHALRADPVYLAAALDATTRL